MAGRPDDSQMVRNARAALTPEGDPLHEEDVSVYDNGGHFVVGVTSFARKLHRLSDDGDVTVEVYEEGIWIDTGGADD